MTAKSSTVVRVARRVDAPPERVFDAWLDPEIARKFLFATPTGRIVRAEIDANIRGSFVIADRRDGVDVVHTGRYLEIDRPRRIAFMFSVDGSPETRVNLDIVPSGSGSEVTLTHELPAEFAEHAAGAEAGWTKILEGLAGVLR